MISIKRHYTSGRALTNVATRGYIHCMKKPSKVSRKASSRVAEASALPSGAPLTVNVRSAKDRLSSLLDLAARGSEIIITSNGKPKGRLTGWQPKRKPFKVDWDLLKSIPFRGGKT